MNADQQNDLPEDTSGPIATGPAATADDPGSPGQKDRSVGKVLIGAELDKVLTILTVTAILAVVIARARRLLVRAVAQRTAASDLSRFFAPEIARQITAAEEQIRAGQGQVRHAAILNTDIRSFTLIAATIEPDELMAILAE